MNFAAHWTGYRRVIVGSMLLSHVVACTHLPGDQKAFKDFDSCIAANLGIAAAGGLTIGSIGTRISNAFSAEKRSAVKANGVVAGVGATALIGLYAWKTMRGRVLSFRSRSCLRRSQAGCWRAPTARFGSWIV